MARDVPAAIDVRPLSIKSQVTDEEQELRKYVQELVGNAAFKNRPAEVIVDLINTNLGLFVCMFCIHISQARAWLETNLFPANWVFGPSGKITFACVGIVAQCPKAKR